ncbi:MAG: ParB/RepB/Spo0J family partition protein [Planctomycetota bacterium]
MPALTLPFLRLDPEAIEAGDTTFRVRRKWPPELEASIRRAGIRTPLLVQPARGRYRVVSGWGRWAARREQDPVPCFSLPEDLSPEEAWDAFLRDNDRWNPIEVGRILRALAAIPGLAEERIVAEKLPLLGIHPSRDLCRRHLRLADLTPAAQDFAEDEGLSLRRAEILLAFSPAAVEAFVRAARELRLTASEIGEALALLEEISRRDGVPPELALQQARRATGAAGKERFRRELRARRYPELSGLEARLEDARAALRFRVPAAVSWDRTLERPGIRLAADLARSRDLETLAEDLRANREAIARFFEIL